MASWTTAKNVLCGFLLGTCGVKILSSDEAKNVYTHVTAAVMKGADDVMKTATAIKESAQDIHADAKAINEKKAEEKKAAIIADAKAFLEETEAETEA